MLAIPKNNENVQATGVNPRRLILISFPKCGKTRSALQLKDNFLVDLENSSSLYSGTKMILEVVAKENNVSKLRALKMITDALRSDPRKYVTIDTITELQDLARDYATIMYKQTLQGKGFTGKDVVSELPQGAGYLWLRNATDEILSWFEGTYTECLIILGHVKLASINKDGKDIQVTDIELVGEMLAHTYLIAGISLESSILQHNHEIWISVRVKKY
jgi:hypothetical protein